MDQPLSDQQLTELETITQAAAPAPWVAFVQNGLGGDSFIRLDGLDDQFPPDMYIHRDDKIAPDADIEFMDIEEDPDDLVCLNLIAELERMFGRS